MRLQIVCDLDAFLNGSAIRPIGPRQQNKFKRHILTALKH
jgi:hypothetical protein